MKTVSTGPVSGIASLYRTLPSALVPQGSSVLYMLNQLGASVGIATVALVVQTAGDGDAVRGFRAAAWTVTIALVVTLAAATQLPGRPGPRQQPEESGPPAAEESAPPASTGSRAGEDPAPSTTGEGAAAGAARGEER
ncbi:hypothetical protein [Streptomyces omiyaensis]|uniref:MFS transporter n=1 Tax=Streptomyces omiyaensis TaxID=68247 RepID=A0ABW7BU92_9ACTN